MSKSMGRTRACRLVVRARERPSGVGGCQPQVPERKFKSHPGVPPARLTEVWKVGHLSLDPVTSVQSGPLHATCSDNAY